MDPKKSVLNSKPYSDHEEEEIKRGVKRCHRKIGVERDDEFINSDWIRNVWQGNEGNWNNVSTEPILKAEKNHL